MSNVRGGISHNGFRSEDELTMAADAATSAIYLVSGRAYMINKVVTVTGNYKAGFGSAGDPIYGAIKQYERDHYMTVQVGGEAEVPGVSGKLPTAAAKAWVCCNGDGAVSVAVSSVTDARAVSVDNTASVNTVMIIIG